MVSEPKPEEKVTKPAEEIAHQATDIQTEFLELLRSYPIKNPETMVDYISAQGEKVLEDPNKLATALAECEISPVRRRQILKHWCNKKDIELPPAAVRKVMPASEKDRTDEEGAEERIYVVDPDTAILRLAKDREKGTTFENAQKLQKAMKKDLAESIGDKKEPAFIVGEGGAWTLNPKSKIGFGEFAVFQMYQDSLKKGEPIDPVEELARREEASVRLKEAMGVKAGGGDTEMGLLDKLEKLGMLRKGEGGEGAMLAQLSTLGLLKTSGEGEGSETMRALQTEVRELRESLHKQELDNVKGIVVSLSSQVSELRADMAKEGKLEGRYALMEKTISTIDTQLSGIRSDARPLLESFAHGSGRPEPKVRTPEEKTKIAKGLKDAVVQEKRAHELEDELLFGKPPPG